MATVQTCQSGQCALTETTVHEKIAKPCISRVHSSVLQITADIGVLPRKMKNVPCLMARIEIAPASRLNAHSSTAYDIAAESAQLINTAISIMPRIVSAQAIRTEKMRLQLWSYAKGSIHNENS